ncbi:MAG: flippase-like domain-containing protein [Candidatus Latescibacteria bacterium]|nr:flippase-like domain-containing protein [Candidatus Latescibacterota bacterium]
MKRIYRQIRRHATLVRIAVVFLLFALLLKNIHPRLIARAFMQADPFYLGIAVLFLVPNIFLQVLKWHFILGTGGAKARLRDAAVSLVGGFFLGAASPGRTGELARGVFIPGQSGVKIASLTIVDKGFNQAMVVIVALFSLMLLMPWPLAVVPILLEAVVLIVLFNIHRLEPHLERLLHRFTYSERVDNALAAFDTLSTRSVTVMLFYSVAFYSVYVIQFYFFILAFSDLSVFVALKTLPVVYLIQLALPITIGDFGVKEMATVKLLSPFGISGEFAFGATLTNNVLTFLIPSIAGGVIITFFHPKRDPEAPSSDGRTIRSSGNTHRRAVS